jgi:hypothetical protein
MAISNSITQRGAVDGGRGFNINDFRAYRDNAGILRTHDYHIEIPFPDGLQRTAALTGIARDLELTCDSVNFPSTSPLSYRVQRYSYGAFEQRPTTPAFSDLQCTFVTDQYSQLWQFFHRWLQVAVNYDFDAYQTTGGQMDVYEVSYKHEYAVDMKLWIYNPLGELVRKVGFREAWPKAVNDTLLNWAARDQLIRIEVAFAFFDWSDENIVGGISIPTK